MKEVVKEQEPIKRAIELFFPYPPSSFFFGGGGLNRVVHCLSKLFRENKVRYMLTGEP